MIGIFDSGVGGLSILRAINTLLPNQSFVYLADQAHVPYGPRSTMQIRSFVVAITQYLIDQGVKLVVIACNTASGAALQHVREQFPQIPIVGLVPAIKPAAEQTLSGKIAVLATPGTFHGKLYLNVKNQHAKNVIVYQNTCPGLVEQIEKGELTTPATRAILESALLPLLPKGIDKVVLGCTHYPFVAPLIQNIVGSQIDLIDPAPAIARRVKHVLDENHLLADESTSPIQRFISTHDPQSLTASLKFLLDRSDDVVELIQWNEKSTAFVY